MDYVPSGLGDGVPGSESIMIVIDAVARETMLFAAIGFLIGGIDDVLADLAYFAVRVRGWLVRRPKPALDDGAGAMAIFVPAWDEAAVIAPMLRTALARYDYPDFRIYVGAYPNDRATIAEVAGVADGDARVRLVIGEAAGPTTKADCLNSLWRALLADEAEGWPVRAVVLHDAEDVVHPAELRVFAAYLDAYDAVQIPVLPLADSRSPLVEGHYLDEFAEAHGKALVVRQALGAALPFAGVGCAIGRGMLGRIAGLRGGMPFDATSLTEDYELGLTVAAMGGRSCFVRRRDARGGLIAVRAFFPATLGAAVRQKARWMMGIALAGWDRTGWAHRGGIGEHWMRMRDRRATLAIPVLAIAYLALVAWGASLAGHVVTGTPLPRPEGAMRWVLGVNAGLLGWRLALRMAFTGRSYGLPQALLSVPRVVVANLVALLAARRALALYWRTLRGERAQWDKTAHRFPEGLVQ
ncbi:glycosyl transferase family protein [Sphingomonas tagetis]|uniref:glycosyl transferase family protein n=1 Tax=Sphingomonas tagetis TaxID=2949092 RepID=UPI00345E69C8